MKSYSPEFWQNKGAVSQLLGPLSILYAGVYGLRALLYRWGLLKVKKLPCPIVVVGNVMAGGVGKTPVVIELVRRLQKQGYQVGVVSRGYGRQSKECKDVNSHSTSVAVGDEPLLIHLSTKAPVMVHSDRVLAIQTLLAQYPQTQIIVSDDGLQHLAMARDIEIVVFDERGVGNGCLLPAGPLREPWPRRAQGKVYFVLQNIPRRLADYTIDGHGQHADLFALQGRPVHAIAAIAKPDQFFAMLREKGIVLSSQQALPDHDSLLGINLPGQAHDVTVCTEKDAVKLWPKDRSVLAVPLRIDLDNDFLKAFDATISTLLAGSGRQAQV